MKIGDKIHRFETCASTNDEARRLAVGGEGEGTVIVSGSQTAGRGTRGRTWFSPPGSGLYMTVILRPSAAPLTLLPLAVGLAARDAAADISGASLRLKWPNDIVHEGRKLGGILCESGRSGDREPFVLAGVGFDVAHAPEDFPPELRDRAVSLKIAAGHDVNSGELLGRMCSALELWYNIYKSGTGEDIVRAFQEWMTFSPGDAIRLESGGTFVEGKYIGLDRSGGLVCESGGRRTTHFSADALSSGPDETRS